MSDYKRRVARGLQGDEDGLKLVDNPQVKV